MPREPGHRAARLVVIINDYTVLAGTQGYFHHRKIDRILGVAREQNLPVVMYTEGGGGRPGDTDVAVQIAGLNLSTFALWAGMAGQSRAHRGEQWLLFCRQRGPVRFAADIRIATRESWIGMAGPAMIEGRRAGQLQADRDRTRPNCRPAMAWSI